MVDVELAIAVLGALLLAAALGSRISSRLGVPVLLLFLTFGMVAGSDGPGGVHFTDFRVAQLVGIVALALILFSAGLSTHWRTVRPMVGPAIALSTLGVGITAVIVGASAVVLLGLPWKTGLLIGAIVSSTDAAAVFGALRGRGGNLKDTVTGVLELESGGNDPMAAFLTIACIEAILHPGEIGPLLVVELGIEAALGIAGGIAFGRIGRALVNRSALDFEGLYPVVTLGVALMAFAVTTLAHGSGFLAVYVAGLTLASEQFLHRGSLMRFHDGLAWLAQIVMFLTLGLLVFPSDLPAVAWEGLVIAAVLVFVARPAAVLVSLAASRLGLRERLFLSWVGLRGAVPIVLATFPLVREVPDADVIFDVVFFVVIASVLLQGTTAPMVARRLGVTTAPAPRPFPIESVSATDASLQEYTVAAGSRADGASIVSLGLGQGALAVLVNRDDAFVVPQGSTVLAAGDRVLIVSDGGAETGALFDAT